MNEKHKTKKNKDMPTEYVVLDTTTDKYLISYEEDTQSTEDPLPIINIVWSDSGDPENAQVFDSLNEAQSLAERIGGIGGGTVGTTKP